MLDTSHKTHRISSLQGAHPSLLGLRATLIAAKRESPSRPQKVDPNEQRALELIARMRTEYRKPLPFSSWKDDSILHSFRLQEVIGNHV